MKKQMKLEMFAAAFTLAASAVIAPKARAQGPLVLPDNMKVLRATLPDAKNRFLGSNAPGQLFLPREVVNLRFALPKDDGPKNFAIEMQEISTRNPDARAEGSWTDTSGAAPLIALEGRPLVVPIRVMFTDKPEAEIELKNFPLPKKFGTYALILLRGAGGNQTRQFLATIARVPQPNPQGTIDNTPVFGEGQFIDGPKYLNERAQQYFRMGVRGWRTESGWTQKPDGTTDWAGLDALFKAAKNAGCQIMVTLSGTQSQWMPLGQPIPAANWSPQTGGYSGTGDWLMAPKDYPQYGAWISEFSRRYWENGKGGLWGFENYNEPWEGGGISGWARDVIQYREIQKTIATAAKKVDPRIKVLAASSIMNTEDKLYSDGSNAMDAYVDIFTDHYVVPAMSYGPQVAASHGKKSMETETWIVNSEYLLPQTVAQFMAAGQSHIAPWHPRVLFDNVPGSDNGYFIPTPTVVATAAFNAMVTGKTFDKLVFHEHLPFVFQFGQDNDRDALLVMFGQLMALGGSSPKDQLWAQVNGVRGGTITIDNRDGLLQFYDLAGNPTYQNQKTITLPLSTLPTYLKSKRGPIAAAARLKAARIDGKRPVEILPRDFNTPIGANSVLRVDVHNCLNRDIKGTLAVKVPQALATRGAVQQTIAIPAGKTVSVAIHVGWNLNDLVNAALNDARVNTFPFEFNWTSDAGNATYAENINVAIAAKGTKAIDGNLDDWANVPGVSVIGATDKIDPTELLRRPWLQVARGNPTATVGEIKLAWDENNLYVAARVQDPTPEVGATAFSKRDENSFFHSAASDNEEPYKTFIEDYRKRTNNPNASFADYSYVYRRSPEAGIPFRRDRVQIALDVAPGWHDMKPNTRVPLGFHAVPDTDYEYSIYGFEGGAEVWRHLAPGVGRLHDFPRQVRGAKTTGVVPASKVVVRREGNTLFYEAAIPKSELAGLNLKAGSDFGFTFKIGNSGGPQAEYGLDKAVTKLNGLTLHPYWERSPSAATRWTLTEGAAAK